MTQHNPHILHLTLKKHWFDEIKAGRKRIEYREVKPYWTRRLIFTGPLGTQIPRQFSEVHFRNGYRKNSSMLRLQWKGMSIGKWKGKDHYMILLGEEILPQCDGKKNHCIEVMLS